MSILDKSASITEKNFWRDNRHSLRRDHSGLQPDPGGALHLDNMPLRNFIVDNLGGFYSLIPFYEPNNNLWTRPKGNH